jgi:hypothetical protein
MTGPTGSLITFYQAFKTALGRITRTQRSWQHSSEPERHRTRWEHL